MKNILYTKFFDEKITENVNVILSPQFYWIKKIEIPLKSIREAKKIANNYFKLDGDFFFDAVKIGDYFFAIAIDKNLELKIDKKYINSIYIAQVELFEFNEINIDKNYQLKKIEDILFCFPTNNEDASNINDVLPNLKLSNNSLNLYNSMELDKGVITLLFSIFLILNFSLMGLIYSYKKELSKLEIERDNLASFNLPLTNIQLDSILSELKEIKNNNITLKENLKFLTKIPLKRGEEFVLLEKRGDRYLVKIKTDRNFNDYLKKRFIIKNFSLKNSIYEVELQNG